VVRDGGMQLITENLSRARHALANEGRAVGQMLACLWRHDWRSDGIQVGTAGATGRYCRRCLEVRPAP
jgi:hypothetical protein